MMAAGAYRFTVAQAGLIHTASNLELILFLYDNLMLSPSLLSPVARCDKCGCFVYESKQYRIVSISVIDTYLSNALHTQSSFLQMLPRCFRALCTQTETRSCNADCACWVSVPAVAAEGVSVGSSPLACEGSAAAMHDLGLCTWQAVWFDVHCNVSIMSSTLSELA